MISIQHIVKKASKKTLAIYLFGIPLAFVISVFIYFSLSAREDISDSHTKPTISNKGSDHTITEDQTNDERAKNEPNTTDRSNTSTTAGNIPSNDKPTPKYRPFECKNVSIPKKTEYIDDDFMPKGATRTISTGQDGYYTYCSSDSTGYTPPTNGTRIEPVNDLVAVGTGLDEQRQQQAAAEEAARTQRYYVNLMNCIQNLKAQGMQPSSAESRCRSIVRR